MFTASTLTPQERIDIAFRVLNMSSSSYVSQALRRHAESVITMALNPLITITVE